MYVLQEIAEKFKTMSGSTVQAIATLKRSDGSVAHIATDDHCYVLYIQLSTDWDRFSFATHWPKEVVDAAYMLRTSLDPVIKCTAQVKFTPASEVKDEPVSPTEPKIENKEVLTMVDGLVTRQRE